MNSQRLTLGIAAIAVSFAIVTCLRMERANQRLGDEVRRLQEKLLRLAAVPPTNSLPATAKDDEELTRLRSEHQELLRLRGEIGVLRQLQAELNQIRSEQADRDRKQAEQLAEKKARMAQEQLVYPKMRFAQACQ